MSVKITEQVHRVIVDDDVVRVVTAGVQGPQGPQGPPGDADMSEVEDHMVATQDVHGIVNTAALETQSGAQSKADDAVTAHDAATGVHGVGASTVASTDDVNTAQSAAQDHADSAVSDHNAATIVHGVDTTQLATQADVDAVLPDPTVDGDVLTLADGSPSWTAPESGGGEIIQTSGMIAPFSFWNIIIPGWEVKGVQNGSVFADWLYYYPIIIDRPLTISGTSVQVSDGVDEAVHRQALYSWNDGTPFELIEDFGVIDVSTSGNKVLSVATTIPAGRYFIAHISSGAIQFSGPTDASTCLAAATIGRRSNWSWESSLTRVLPNDPASILTSGMPQSAIPPGNANVSNRNAVVAFIY